MTDTLGAQLSAFIDDELPDREAGMLVRRLRDDVNLRLQFASYALIGETMRGGAVAPAGLSGEVHAALLAEERHVATGRDWLHTVRPAGMAAVAASVALLAIFGLRAVTQPGADSPAASMATLQAPLSSAPNAQVAGSPANLAPVSLPGTEAGVVVPEPDSTQLATPSLYDYMIRHAAVSTGPQSMLPRAFVVPERDRTAPDAADAMDETP